MSFKYCTYCCLSKPFDAKAKRYSKEQGFYGARCWDCLALSRRSDNTTIEQLRTLRIEWAAAKQQKQLVRQQRAVVSELESRGLRLCNCCKEWKPYDGTKLAYSKASGFQRHTCWTCWLEKVRVRNADPLKRFTNVLRTRITIAIKNGYFKEDGESHKMFGCNINELFGYLEEQFVNGMTWYNYGTYWEIDHRHTLSAATTPKDLMRLCHYTNLRPLEVSLNKLKAAAYDPAEVAAYLALFDE